MSIFTKDFDAIVTTRELRLNELSVANIPFIDDRIFSPTLLAVSALTFLSAFTRFMMFLRLLPVSRGKGLWVARALRMVTVLCPSYLLPCLSCLIHIFVLFSRVKLNSPQKHCSALQVRERRLLFVSSETAFLARLMQVDSTLAGSCNVPSAQGT